MSDKKSAFSFKPHRYVSDNNGGLKVDHENSNPYIFLQSHTQGKLYYTPKDNKYWIAEGVEAPAELLESRFLPYMRWKFDQWDEKDGKSINLCPPSPENIMLKRKELIEEAMNRGELINQNDLLQITSPIELKNNAAFQSKLDQASPDERLIQRLNKSGI